MMAQIITQQPLFSFSVINFFSLLLQAMISAIHQFKKLPDTAEYDEDRDYLNV